jgi:alkylated DNA repair dioxygenase AlkB
MTLIAPPQSAAQAAQADLFGNDAAAPEGFRYQPDLLGPREEEALVRRLAQLPFEPFDFHGYKANRKVVGFGLRYDYTSRQVLPAPPIPDWLTDLRLAAAGFAGRPAEAFVQVLINEYAPDAGIGWHRDKPHFGEVIGVSLLSPCRLRFRRKAGAAWDRQSALLEPRSAYLLSGPSRWVWEHSIPPVSAHRYSITFRSVATPGTMQKSAPTASSSSERGTGSGPSR